MGGIIKEGSILLGKGGEKQERHHKWNNCKSTNQEPQRTVKIQSQQPLGEIPGSDIRALSVGKRGRDCIKI